MSVLNEIAARLATAGVGVLGTDLFIGTMPNDPDVCTAVYEYQGLESEKAFGTAGVDVEYPAVQVVCRGARPGPGVSDTYSGPRAKAETAYRELAKIEAETVSAGAGGTSAFYHEVTPRAAPQFMKRDEAQRVYIVTNFICEKEPSA